MRTNMTALAGRALLLSTALVACEDLGSAPGPVPLDRDNSAATPSDAGADAATDAGGGTPFCADYGATCGFGGADRFANSAACESFQASASGAVAECTQKHLELATTDAATHCPHAAGSGPCAEQAAFCTAYEARCGFDAAGFADANACSSGFTAFDATQRACVEMHIDLAVTDPTTHCPHARGQGPCAATGGGGNADPFCGQYALTCSFGGGDRYASLDECGAERAAMSEATRKCTGDHLALANADPTTHCPHATGQGPCDPATFFCTGYETNCGFTGIDRFASSDACRQGYEAFSPIVQACAEEHLQLAVGDPDTHCPHAQGQGPCEGSAAFCSLYTTRCGYGGANRFADLSDCQSSIDSFSTARQACVEEHLGLAASDAALHCPHATGLGPCVNP